MLSRSSLFSGVQKDGEKERLNIRVAQFRSAKPRTSVAQQTALGSEPVQTAVWRSLNAGIAEARALDAPRVRPVRMVEKRILYRKEESRRVLVYIEVDRF